MKLKLDLICGRTLIIGFADFDLAVKLSKSIKKIKNINYLNGKLQIETQRSIEVIDITKLENNLFIHDADVYTGPNKISKGELQELIKKVEGIEWDKADFFKDLKLEEEAYMIMDGLLFNFYKEKNLESIKLRVALRTSTNRYVDFYLHGNGHFAVLKSNVSTENRWKAMFYVERNQQLLKAGMTKKKWVKQL